MKTHRQAGYSLAEMLTVIAIIGSLALVTVPSFITFYQSNKMKTSMRNFMTDLRSVRQRAITRGHQMVVTYSVGANNRKYYFFEGNLPNNSTTWTPVALTEAGTSAAEHRLDDVVYFPSNSTNTPQTFDDTLNCSLTTCSAGTDSKPEILFFPDGRARIPSGSTLATVTIKTDLRIPVKQYNVQVTPSGGVKAVAQ